MATAIKAKGTQAFLKSTQKLAKKAQRDGVTVKKAQVTEALTTLTKDGKVSRADVSAAKSFMDAAPLTRAAKATLKDFVEAGTTADTVKGQKAAAVRAQAHEYRSHTSGGESGFRSRGGGESRNYSEGAWRGGGE